MRILDSIGNWFQTGVHDAWHWVATLSLQEWLLFLAVASAAGFLCMRGYGSRGNY
jgi:hypothetical protein